MGRSENGTPDTAPAPREYTYLGDRMTRPELVEARCTAVLDEIGRRRKVIYRQTRGERFEQNLRDEWGCLLLILVTGLMFAAGMSGHTPSGRDARQEPNRPGADRDGFRLIRHESEFEILEDRATGQCFVKADRGQLSFLPAPECQEQKRLVDLTE